MNGIMNENVIVKEYEFDKPVFHKIDSSIDNCTRDCHNEITNILKMIKLKKELY